MKPNNQKGSDESQLDRFKEAARAAECDEDPAAFDAKMRALVKVKAGAPSKAKRPARKT